MRYEEPYLKLIVFEKNDIITLSVQTTPGSGTDTGEGGDSGDFGF